MMLTRSILYLCLFILLRPSLSNDEHDYFNPKFNNIAVCVSGQVSRWIPETAVKYLLEANLRYRFTFFFNLQYHTSNSSFIFSTDAHISFHPTKFVSMQQSEMFDYIHSMYGSVNNTKIASISYVPPRRLQEWENDFFKRKADRISQYSDVQHVILNFYAHQIRCVNQIEEYERLSNSTFDYVLSSREDIYYFRSVPLDYLLSHLKVPIPSEEPISSIHCDLIAKDCLQWGGMNMRWQLMTRNATEWAMKRRIEYYRELFTADQVIYNPEQFESAQMKFYKLRVCEFSSNVIANAVGRHIINDEICFLRPETLDNCIPGDFNEFVQQRLCHKIHHHRTNKPPAPESRDG